MISVPILYGETTALHPRQPPTLKDSTMKPQRHKQTHLSTPAGQLTVLYVVSTWVSVYLTKMQVKC